MIISVLSSDGEATNLELHRERKLSEASQLEVEHIVIVISIETVQDISSMTAEYTVNGRHEGSASALLNGGESISLLEICVMLLVLYKMVK